MKYKHLKTEEILKIQRNKRWLSRASIFMKWSLSLLLIIFIFISGFFLFCKKIDNDLTTTDSMIYSNNRNSINNINEINQETDKPDNTELHQQNTSKEVIENSTDTDTAINLDDKNKEVIVNKIDTDINVDDKKKLDIDYDYSDWNKTAPDYLKIVCKNNKIPDFKLTTTEVAGKPVNTIIAEELKKMIAEAKKQGIDLTIISGYRNEEHQKLLFANQKLREKTIDPNISDEDSELRASMCVARPNESEHQLGLAVDFVSLTQEFDESEEYSWLITHARKFGFIHRYKKEWQSITHVIYEPWHWRYVGVKHAQEITKENIPFEEYIMKLTKTNNNNQKNYIPDLS
ncbi:MAG: D-alanyl-D-alanine carboxypeptidase family protein [Candidatus Improbicoccus devescovinae]|nr:MAG: D-alanyl-D-alanine carboxypeptidase family protein [Candidatus Improbicoccus devescovinae]